MVLFCCCYLSSVCFCFCFCFSHCRYSFSIVLVVLKIFLKPASPVHSLIMTSRRGFRAVLKAVTVLVTAEAFDTSELNSVTNSVII